MTKYIKNISLAFILLLSLPCMAQDATEEVKTNKKTRKELPKDLLPVAGDFSIGISANPIINFIGNMFNSTVSQRIGNIGGSPSMNGMAMPNAFPTVSIMGKYMLTENLGFRVNAGVIVNMNNDSRYVADDAILAQDPLSLAKVTDWRKILNTGGSFTIGVEYRVGKRRIQGVFGGSLLYAYSLYSAEYTYGNAITELNQLPSTTDFNGGVPPVWKPVSTAIPNARVLENYTSAGSHTAGLVGHIGIEIFIAPKISIGAEVNLALLYGWTPEQYETLEGFNVLTAKVEQYTNLISPKSNSLLFGTQNIGANLMINFYF